MKITENCFAVLGLGYYPPWIVNSGFVVGSHKTIVVDSGPNYIGAQTIYGYAKNVKPDNELILINTEKHLDHIGGNCYFNEKGVMIYGHKLINRSDADLNDDINYFNQSILDITRRNAKEEQIFFSNTKIVNPEFHVNDGEIINPGNDLDVRIIFTPGHTQTNICIYVPNDKVLYCGDCMTNGFLPNLGAGTVEDWKVWLKSLDIIASLDISYIVPGHGDVISEHEISKELTRLREIIEAAIEQDKAPDVNNIV